jgi:DNA-binding response OmpR family regulator
MRILVIDDEPHVRQMIRLTLEAAGYQVEEASTGEEGLASFGDGSRHDAVVLDQKMPGIDGLETLLRIKQRTPDAAVLVVTAFASIELAVAAMKLGATDFIRKPMTPETLRGALAAVLGRRTSRGPVRQASAATLNAFQILRSREPVDPASREHVFRVKHFPDGAEFTVTVTIDSEAIERVARLSRRNLRPGGAFWREQAERLLSAWLWSEGKGPESGRLTVHDVSHEDLDAARAWQSD